MRWGRIGIAAAVALVSALLALGGSVRTATGAPVCNLVPQLRDVSINQGVGSYSPLEYGKETLVRLYLSMPSCAPSGASVQVTGATLSMSGASQSNPVPMTPTPSPTAFPTISTFSTAPMPDSTGDPTFVVPGSGLSPSGGGAFTATFAATVNWQSKASRNSAPVAGTPVTFTKLPTSLTNPAPSGTNITAAFDKKTNPFHVLVVPMGDNTKPYNLQFSAAAQAAVQDGMTGTVARIFPVPTGVGNLGSTGGQGLQYTITPTLLPLNGLVDASGVPLLDSTGRFCGTGVSYDVIKGQLFQMLRAWQTGNPGVQVDSVLGEIDPQIAKGPPDPCFEGMGVLGSAETWAQAITGRAGQIAGLELAHTLGLVPKDRESPFDAGHSQNITAENPSLNRRFNLVQRAFVPTDRSLMKPSASSPTPDNVNTLFEAPDFAYARAVFGGTTNTEFTQFPKTLGSITAATLAFVMSGTTNGSAGIPAGSTGDAAGTNVVESYFSSQTQLTQPDPTSGYFLRQMPSGTVTGVPVGFVNSEHGGNGTSQSGSAGLFSIAQPTNPNTTRIEFWKGQPGASGSLLLYARNQNDPPVITGMSTGSPVEFRAPKASTTGSVPSVSPPPSNATRTRSRGGHAAGLRTHGARAASWPAPSLPFLSWTALDPIFTVNSTGDGADANTADNNCDDGTGNCTLRAAIQQANAIPGADTINFAIGTGLQTIAPTTALPQITDPVTIDGWTQGGSGYTGPPLIELNGASAPGDGLGITNQTTIRGLIINRFPGAAVNFFSGAVGSDLESNYIGTNAAGTASLGNGGGAATFASGVTFANNVISGNGYGILLASDGNGVSGNFIGTNAAGSAALGNVDDGVELQASSSNVIQNNVISGTTSTTAGGAGIDLFQSATQSSSNTIQNNKIGTDASGTAAIPNKRRGIMLNGASTNAIQFNTISGNTGDGVDIANGTGNIIKGNGIGIAADGTGALGNGGFGVQVSGSASLNKIGAADPDGNVIANNGSAGVEIGSGTGDSIIGNRIYSNGSLGINLGADLVTANDPGDTDTGANNLQNFPVLSDATLSGGQLTLTGTLDTNAGLADPNFRVEAFLSSSCDPSGNGEGEFFVGSSAIAVDGSGHSSFSLPFPTSATGTVATATVTAVGTGDTSEFSACVTVGGGGGDETQLGPTFTVNTADDHTDAGGCTVNDCSLREAIAAANAHANGVGALDQIDFAIVGTGPQQIAVLASRGGALPTVTDAVFIDGDTQREMDPGIPADSKAIVLNGDGAGSVDGLVLGAGSAGSRIKGLAIGNFHCATGAPSPCSTGYGVDVQSNGNTIDGNSIGLQADGVTPASNTGGGVFLEGNSNTIGGTTAGERNVIAANAVPASVRSQVRITGNSNTLKGNYLGVAGNGTTELNDVAAITLQGGATGNTIGGDKTVKNIILGTEGIEVQSAGNTIAGNDIGLDASGAVHNETKNPGIHVSATSGTVIGDSVVPPGFANPDKGNVIVGRTGDAAVFLEQGTSTIVGGNFLGTNRTGATGMGNAEGIRVSGGGGNNLGPGNTIARNTGFGVDVGSAHNRIVANSIHDNGDLGIHVDSANVVTGAPVITSATKSGGTTTVSGTFTGAANTTFFIEPFKNTACDPTGFGEGETYLNNFASATTNGSGNASFTYTDSSLVLGDKITVTATNSTTAETGQFSNCKTVTPASTVPPGQEQVNVNATDDHPTDMRLDLFLDCGAGKPKLPIAVGLKPASTGTTTATFSYNYDPSLACPNGTLKAIGNDGFTSTGFTTTGSTSVDPGPNTPRAAVSNPLDGKAFLTYSLIPLRGSVRDSDGELLDNQLHWTVTGPGITRSGTGHQVDLNPPASGGWPSGPYTATLTGTNADGKTGTATVNFAVKTDADNDGMPADVEGQSCFTTGDNDPLNAYSDYDGDGIPNSVDPQPCTPATSYTAIADFNPDPLPLTSTGNTVTVDIRIPGRNVAQVIGSSVRITRIADADVSADPNFQNIAWTIANGVGTAKFDRQKLIQYLNGRGIHNRVISITVAGSGGPWSFQGSDTTFVQG